MAWPATDKAIAELLLKMPGYLGIIAIFAVCGFLLFGLFISMLLKDKRFTPAGSSHLNPATEATEEILKASDHTNDGKRHLLLAATGSVATIKIPNIVQALARYSNLSIRIILTESATNFLAGQAEEQPSLATIRKMPNVDGIYRDADEWRRPWTRGASILHIELRRWADLMIPSQELGIRRV
ncbi:related to SIS2 protein (cycle-specific gene control) [Ramularia collo-cygni]|uniref:Related to SIS2 protein (Cycle-specific gene control) n=1 Tax=Ramularia collo-cygni TaxID=112498 RepID=A0A2D3VH73_9PEZI|nr:related to SIS2 protein (cycle-specific gene control) [Ramularia collo-cygni]CZT24642.1 related to SIS2 protein (cycle-specific gene control) [Ramularia collo-cygni]